MTCLVRDLQSTSSFSSVNIMIFFFSVVIDAFMNFSNRLNIKLNNYYCNIVLLKCPHLFGCSGQFKNNVQNVK